MSDVNVKPITLDEYARRLQPCVDVMFNRSLFEIINSQAVMGDWLALHGPLTREPLWRRMLRRCGDALIRAGVAMGGETERFDD